VEEIQYAVMIERLSKVMNSRRSTTSDKCCALGRARRPRILARVTYTVAAVSDENISTLWRSRLLPFHHVNTAQVINLPCHTQLVLSREWGPLRFLLHNTHNRGSDFRVISFLGCVLVGFAVAVYVTG
jgi:hypothetical protein